MAMVTLNLQLLLVKAFFMTPAWWTELKALGVVNGNALEIEEGRLAEFQARHRLAGLGDLVSLAAQPIAKALDSTLGTHVATCKGCEDRKDGLNAAVPFN